MGMENMSEAYMKVIEYHMALGAKSLKDDVVILKVDDNWTIGINGKRQPYEFPASEEFMGGTVDPFNVGVWWHGWLAGLLGPAGGVIAAHETGANEDHLIEALSAATAAIARTVPA